MLAAAKEQAIIDAWRISNYYRREWKGYLTVPSVGELLYCWDDASCYHVFLTSLYEEACETVELQVKGGKLHVNYEQMHDVGEAICDYWASITSAFRAMKEKIKACSTIEELHHLDLESLRDSIKFTH